MGWSARLSTIFVTTSMKFHCRNDFIPSRNQDHSRFSAEAWEYAFGNSQKQLISGNCGIIVITFITYSPTSLNWHHYKNPSKGKWPGQAICGAFDQLQPPFYNSHSQMWNILFFSNSKIYQILQLCHLIIYVSNVQICSSNFILFLPTDVND